MKESFTADQKLINRLREMILDNLGNEKFGISELAQAAGMSSQRLNRKLYSTTKKTIHQFILETRLHKAMEMLENEDVTSSEVAYKTGFSSPSHFNTSFHKLFGYPPGKVKRSVSAGATETLISTDKLKQKKQRFSWRIIAFISGISLTLFIVIYLVYTAAHKVSPERSIAVLPFRNLSNDLTDQYVYDGIMEEIFNNLGKVKELRVISHTSVEQFRNTTRQASEIGKDLNVNFIVEGSGQKIGSRSILRVQLIEVPADKHIWTGSYDLEFMGTEDLFHQISQIAQSIASELGATITPEEKELIEKVPTQNKIAYNLYRKANSYEKHYEKSRDPSSYQTAVNLYNAALEIDTVFARAYSGLALAYWSRYYSETYFKQKFLDSCHILADKALSFDDKLDEAYYVKGKYYQENGHLKEALDNYDKALRINPNYSQVYIKKGSLLAWTLNDYVNGIDNYYKAINLIRGNDRSSILYYLGNLFMNVGFMDKAKYYFKEALTLNGDSARYFGALIYVEFGRENFEEAYKMAKKAYEIDTTFLTDFITIGIPPVKIEEAYQYAKKMVKYYEKSGRLNLQDSYRVGFAFYQAGKKEEAEYYFDQQIKYSEEGIKLNRDIGQRKVAQYDLAAVYAFKGDKVKAYKYLDEYSERSYFRPAEISLTKYDPLFASIRNEERFQKIVKMMETKYQAEHDRVRRWLEKEGML
jgi:TolB-like protein/AraC-like DNA-binding protein/lipoprotein NlpI